MKYCNITSIWNSLTLCPCELAHINHLFFERHIADQKNFARGRMKEIKGTRKTHVRHDAAINDQIYQVGEDLEDWHELNCGGHEFRKDTVKVMGSWKNGNIGHISRTIKVEHNTIWQGKERSSAQAEIRTHYSSAQSNARSPEEEPAQNRCLHTRQEVAWVAYRGTGRACELQENDTKGPASTANDALC